MKFLTNEVKIALAAIVGIVILFAGMQFLKGLNVFSSADKYYVRFSDILVACRPLVPSMLMVIKLVWWKKSCTIILSPTISLLSWALTRT